jgi:uncharacterized membrane protein YfcA
MFFFLLTWYHAEWWVMLIVALLGASGAVIGEAKKLKWIDDDFMIQIIPAILLLIIWLFAGYLGVVLPDPIIHPAIYTW